MQPRLAHILDALSTRIGLSASLLSLVLICLLTAQYVRESGTMLEENYNIFKDRQLRNGFVSMSDVQRILMAAKTAHAEGVFDEATQARFVEATDFLFVRKENFRRVLEVGTKLDSAEGAIRSLERIVEIADQAIASDYADPNAIWESLLAASEDARRSLVKFLDDMNRLQDRVLSAQSSLVGEQRIVVLASLGGLTFLGACALLLLRREVIARRARNRAEKHIEYLAFYDSLTSLPNRVQFQERLAQLLVDEPHVALLLVDLDNFKIANDTYGHAAGDAVLRSVATTLGKHAQAAAGFAARLGGDEFAIVLKTENRGELDAICDAVFQDANGAFLFEGEALDVSLSIGIATKSQLHSNFEPNVDSLCRVTDFALYSAKADGRGRVTFYDQGLEQRFLDRRAMIDELPLAIEHGDLEVFLQPKVSLPKGEVYGFEALVRWRRNETLVSPDEFITISEESGLIIDIDRYMLNCATAIVAIYNAEHSARLSVSVNLSAIHFSSRRIIGWVKEALSASQLSPELLTLEITETVELRDWAQAQEVISALHRLGARISIDDFGTGYSSLGYLRNTMADEIKIDRSLVEQIETSEKARYLLDAVLNVAEKLDLEVVVEGVETELQADVLHAMGAKRAQGYLFGKPGESQRILSMLDRTPAVAANDASSAA